MYSSSVRETFAFAHPTEQISAIEKYCTAVYGSNLWDLTSTEAEMMFSAWTTGIKACWDVHRGCRTYLVQSVLAPGISSLKTNLLCRFRGFYRNLLVSPSFEVQVVARRSATDIRSSVGSNLALLRELTGGLNPVTVSPGKLREVLVTAAEKPVPAGEEWRVGLLQKLLQEKLKAYYICW